MYFFHYTSKNSYETMTREKPWKCEARQPQKGTWYADQHEKGFYCTTHDPARMTSEVVRKMGGGSRGDYVLVFTFNVSAKDFKGGTTAKVREKIRIKLVGQPLKFALTRSGVGDDTIPLEEKDCVWAGPTSGCLATYRNHESVIEALYQCSTAK